MNDGSGQFTDSDLQTHAGSETDPGSETDADCENGSKFSFSDLLPVILGVVIAIVFGIGGLTLGARRLRKVS